MRYSSALLLLTSLSVVVCTGYLPGATPAEAVQAVTPDICVAVGGMDTNPGTEAAPLATVGAARDAVRKKIAAGQNKDILVQIRGGTYQVTEPTTFGPEDSGTVKFSITYAAAPGEKVVLSGGRRITGWKRLTAGRAVSELWTAEIPDVKAGTWYFRQLFVNGNRAHRARTPNIDEKNAWWTIKSSNSSKDKPAPPDVPVVLSLSGRLTDYSNPADVEFVYTCNNDMGRKRLASVSVADQTITLATPNRWNPQVFKFDWHLSIPTPGGSGQTMNRGYLENAPEMLDQPGEFYLDRKAGVLSYWPRPGEDLAKAEVIAPMAPNTLLAFIGTPDRPIRNVHVRGVRCEYVEWSPPEWGYMGLFCCNLAIHREPDPGHRFIDAAVEYTHARSCSFRDGGVAHVGAMGICLRDGTSDIAVEGNEICDLGGGGVGLGGCNVAAGYTKAAPTPQPGEYRGYRVVNNHVHHCGSDYYGAVGIALFLAQDSVIANNLIHDTAYFGLCMAGDQDPQASFARNNIIERNHVYKAMKVTVDGAGMYITMGFADRGGMIRDNLVHDIVGLGPCGGLYIDTNNRGCTYENNVVYGVPSGRAFIESFSDVRKNSWRDNLMQNGTALPKEFIEALKAYTGLVKPEPESCVRYSVGDSAAPATWSALQYNIAKGDRGVVQIVVPEGYKGGKVALKLQGVEGAASYELSAYASPGKTPMIGGAERVDLASLGLAGKVPGQELLGAGLAVDLGAGPRVMWIAYQKVK